MSREKQRNQAKLLNSEREKNYEFKESMDDLHRSEQGRQYKINTIDDSGGGFVPKSFKSSRSTQKSNGTSGSTKLTADQEYESMVYGGKKPSSSSIAERRLENSLSSNLSAPVEINVVSSNAKVLMHESLFEDIIIKEKRWKQKMLELIKSASSSHPNIFDVQ